jgi:glycerol-3-phosphate O-acyltransferase / dihydroxyacetone phosphate acyltransferase
VLASTLGRLPRFIAKSGLARIPLAGLVLRAAGVVFVHRQVDGGAGGSNDDAFRECHAALAANDTVAIFPEGTTHDRSRMDPLKTGAARIALGARTAGARRLVVVPIGIAYPDKVALRASALVQVGRPIELDVVVPEGTGADDREAVRQLTAVIDRGLRNVTPDFADLETALALEQAAQVALSDERDPDPSLQRRYEVARTLGRAAPEEQARVREAIGRYATMLSGLHLTDRDVVAPTSPTRLLRSALGIAVVVVLLGGLVAATFLVNAIPALLVALVSLVVKTPVSKGTARVLVGLVAFPTAWIAAAVVQADGFLPVLLVSLGGAVGALAAVFLVERALALTTMLLRWQAQRERVRTIQWAGAVRREVVAAVDAARGSVAA